MGNHQRRRFLGTCIAAPLALGASHLPLSALAQSAWPSKPVKIIVPYAAGGPADVTAREIAQKLAVELRQPVVIENQGGGMGIPSLTGVTRAEPDGNTLWMPALRNIVLQPLLSKSDGG